MRDLDEFKGIKLDIGCGAGKSAGWVGLDKRKLDGVDIVHDMEKTPWPIETDSATVILCSHILEHIDPRNFLRVMAEIHRVGKHFCQVQISTPYAGSFGGYQDPTHTRPGFNEATWTYFDPRPINGQPSLWRIYEPPPLFVEQCHWDVNGNIEVLMRVIKDDKFLKQVLNGHKT